MSYARRHSTNVCPGNRVRYTAHSVDHYKALLFVEDAALGVVEQLKYLEQRVVQDISWTESSE